MAHDKDVEKILQNLKKSSQTANADNPEKAKSTIDSDRLSQIISQETAKKNDTAQPDARATVAEP